MLFILKLLHLLRCLFLIHLLPGWLFSFFTTLLHLVGMLGVIKGREMARTLCFVATWNAATSVH